MSPRPPITCRRCYNTRQHKGRGLCTQCYTSVRDAGNLEDYPATGQLLERDAIPAAPWVPPPPEPAPCADAPAWLFIDYDTTVGVHHVLAARDGHPRRVHPKWRDQVRGAFDYCAGCPLATREWCVEAAVRPTSTDVAIVAGAALWNRGRAIWTIDDQSDYEEHGSEAGYERHQRNGEVACSACEQAVAIVAQIRRLRADRAMADVAEAS